LGGNGKGGTKREPAGKRGEDVENRREGKGAWDNQIDGVDYEGFGTYVW